MRMWVGRCRWMGVQLCVCESLRCHMSLQWCRTLIQGIFKVYQQLLGVLNVGLGAIHPKLGYVVLLLIVNPPVHVMQVHRASPGCRSQQIVADHTHQ